MMAFSGPDRLSPRAREIVIAARGLLDEEGMQAAVISAGFEEPAAVFEAAIQPASAKPEATEASE